MPLSFLELLCVIDVHWLLKVPLSFTELLCVVDLAEDQLASKGFTVGLAAAAMVALGYPGEIQDEQKQRFIWRVLAICPFAYVVQLTSGLNEATEAAMKKPAAGVIVQARYLTVIRG